MTTGISFSAGPASEPHPSPILSPPASKPSSSRYLPAYSSIAVDSTPRYPSASYPANIRLCILVLLPASQQPETISLNLQSQVLFLPLQMEERSLHLSNSSMPAISAELPLPIESSISDPTYQLIRLSILGVILSQSCSNHGATSSSFLQNLR